MFEIATYCYVPVVRRMEWVLFFNRAIYAIIQSEIIKTIRMESEKEVKSFNKTVFDILSLRIKNRPNDSRVVITQGVNHQSGWLYDKYKELNSIDHEQIFKTQYLNEWVEP